MPIPREHGSTSLNQWPIHNVWMPNHLVSRSKSRPYASMCHGMPQLLGNADSFVNPSDPSDVWRSPISFSFESPHEVGHGILQCDLRELEPLCCERVKLRQLQAGRLSENKHVTRSFLKWIFVRGQLQPNVGQNFWQQVEDAHQILRNLGYSGLILGLILCQLKLDNSKMAPNTCTFLSLHLALRNLRPGTA